MTFGWKAEQTRGDGLGALAHKTLRVENTGSTRDDGNILNEIKLIGIILSYYYDDWDCIEW